jgi:hypothetical protein
LPTLLAIGLLRRALLETGRRSGDSLFDRMA